MTQDPGEGARPGPQPGSGPVAAAPPVPAPPVPGPVVGELASAGRPGTDGPAGDPAVPAEVGRLQAAVADLPALAGVPVAEHVERYDRLHGELADALAAIDGAS